MTERTDTLQSVSRTHDEEHAMEAVATITTKRTERSEEMMLESVDMKRRRVEDNTTETPVRDTSINKQPGDHPSSDNGISPEGEDSEDEDEEDGDNNMEEAALFVIPAGVSVAPHTPNTQAAGSVHTAGARETSLERRSRRPPDVRGAITTLRSLEQLEAVFSTEPLPLHTHTLPNQHGGSGDDSVIPTSPSARSLRVSASSPVALPSLRRGETVIIILHNGRSHVRELLHRTTEELSQCRIFRLDLSSLPPCEYETHDDSFSGTTTPYKNERPVLTVKADKAASGPESAALTHDDAAVVEDGSAGLPETDYAPSFSSQISLGTERVMQRVCALLRVDELLNPDTHHGATSQPGDTVTSQREASVHLTPPVAQHRRKREELMLPAMVVWRAEGGAPDEYVDHNHSNSDPNDSNNNDNNNNNNNNNKNNNTNDHSDTNGAAKNSGCRPAMASTTRGKLLVVKQLTSVDQLHSLSLLTPVYTVTHLLRTIARTVLPPASAADVSSSRTFIYFGASWCPPCMRIVNALPAMLREDLPRNITCTVKADMDLAMPLFEFFGVEIIPSFAILDNAVLRSGGGWEALCSQHSTLMSQELLLPLHDALRRSEVGRIQNSQRVLVRAFMERYASELRFDEDF